jgi:ribosomal protein S18 acetylase RimI-like enzyme
VRRLRLIREAIPDDFVQIADLIVQYCRRPERRCIHSDPRGGVDQAVEELKHLHAIGELLFVVGNTPTFGCFGAEYDLGLRRAWLRGPFVVSEDAQEWAETARKLLEALEESLPEELAVLDSFLDQANEWGQQLGWECGYQRVRLVHVYRLDPAAPLSEVPAGCVEMQPEQAAAVAALHEQLFPNTYLTAQQIIRDVSAGGATPSKVFVYLEAGQVLGYVYGSENLGEGVVDFLGVDPAARRRGIGRLLLTAILYWLRVDQGLDEVTLTVHDEQAQARRLYEQAGFRLLYTGVHSRKER